MWEAEVYLCKKYIINENIYTNYSYLYNNKKYMIYKYMIITISIL
jgi:hypothetical protein